MIEGVVFEDLNPHVPSLGQGPAALPVFDGEDRFRHPQRLLEHGGSTDSSLLIGGEIDDPKISRRLMTAARHENETLFGIYRLHAELAEQASSSRESLNKLYSGMVTAIVAASLLLHRFAPDSATMWVLPVLGIAVSLSWMLSLHSVTGRLSSKHTVLMELESKLPFSFFERENAEFDKLGIIRRKWSGLLMPVAFLAVCSAWLTTLIIRSLCGPV